MRVLALIESADHVCYRYRIEAFAWALAQRGLFLEVVPLSKSVYHRLGQLRRARYADVTILQRKLLPLWQLRVLRKSARRLIYDVDDLLSQRDSYSSRGPSSWVRLAHFWMTTYASDAVTVGNEFLEDKVSSHIGPERVHVMPTCVEPERYVMADHRRIGSAARLVWIGQRSTMPSLQCAQRQLTTASGRLPGMELRLISDMSLRIPGLRVTALPWSSGTEAARLADCDIGINWLPNDLWSRGKCGLKVLQYMAAGLPVVANPVGMNREMIMHGRNGLLASTPSEWADAIEFLASNVEIRRKMGEEGRRLVEQRFNAASWAPRFAQLVESVATGHIGVVGPDTSTSNTNPGQPPLVYKEEPSYNRSYPVGG